MALLGPRSRYALHRFEADPLVEDVAVSWDRVRVRYATGVIEVWGLDHGRRRRLMFPRSGWWEYRAEILPEYTDLGALVQHGHDADGPMWSVPWSEITRGGFLDRRLLVQRMLERLLADGWLEPTTPVPWLDWDLERLRRVRPEGHVVTPGYLRQQVGRSHRPPPGFSVACALASWAEHQERGRASLRTAFSDTRRLYWGIEACLTRRRDVNRVGLIHAMAAGRAQGHPGKIGPRLVPPSFWVSLLRGVCGLSKPVVLDQSGCAGFVATAVVADAGTYIHPARWPVRRYAPAWAERHGAALVTDDGATADVGLLGDLRNVGFDEMRQRVTDTYERCASVVALVHRADGVAFRSENPGTDVLRLHRWAFQKQDNALMVIHQR